MDIHLAGLAEVLFNNLTLNYDLEKSVASPRVHSELYPNASLIEVEGEWYRISSEF